MRLKICLIFLVLLRSMASFGQEVVTVKLFFGINDYQLSDDNQHKLDDLYKILSYFPRIYVVGYADFLGEDHENLLLSVKRAEAAKTYLLCLNKYLVITTEGRGALPSTKKDIKNGEPFSRRIDIVIKSVAGVKFPPLSQPIVQSQPVKPAPEDIKQFNDKVNKLTTLKKGSSISLDELTFLPGRHVLNPESNYYLKTLLAYLKANEKLIFEIRGHICCDYSNLDGYDIDTHQPALSLSRAQVIYQFLLENGIAASRMHYTGVGSSQPKIYPETSEHDRLVNRRVEIVVMGK